MRIGDGYLSSLVLGGLLSSALGACAVIAGLGTDYRTTADGGTPSDSGACVPVPPESGSACTAKAEDCTDGVDNNCDCLVDCADPQCAQAGYRCTADIPAGWSVVAFNQATSLPCPLGYGGARPIYTMAKTSTCGCACANDECGGLVTIDQFPGDTTCASGVIPTQRPIGNGACLPASYSLNTTDSFNFLANSPTSGCGTAVCTPTPASPPLTTGAVCTSLRLGAGCATGVCAAPAAPGSLCIMTTGPAICPAAYSPAPVASLDPSTHDGRSCGAVSCKGSTLACQPITTVNVFADTACATLFLIIHAGSCDIPTFAGTGLSYDVVFSSSGDPSCTPGAPSTLTDTSTFVTPSTLCCL